MHDNHSKLMQLAINEAIKARQKNEVPVGAALVDGSGKVLSLAHNQTIKLSDPTAHAEILAMRMAAKKLLNYRLLNTTLYVTVEPCIMCMGAIIHARISRIVFGTNDPKWGAGGSLYNFANDSRLNHQPEIIGGVCEDECRELIRDFFRSKRNLTMF
jgi:tRNA(adenine34) deaminase